jgi:exopolyphosphatase/guanosine-5'-triphosphate,3'-diphosphate pyrophosphatase
VLRTAGNAPEFVRQLAEKTGILLEIVAGEKEARLTAAGVLSALDPRPDDCLIVDIGGGSTEFILCHAGVALLHRSYPLGAVRLAEDFADTASMSACIDRIMAKFRAEIEEENLLRFVISPECRLVGTAGTVTTLAALQLQMNQYDWRRVNNLVLHKSNLCELLKLLVPLSVAAREKLPGMEKGRGDLIVPGLHILLAVLDLFSFEQLTVSDFGLLEGILLESA